MANPNGKGKPEKILPVGYTMDDQGVIYNAKGQRVCGARKRGKGGQICKQAAIMANGRCRLHGGTQIKGPAHHAVTFGRYSKYLPQSLTEFYADAMVDENYISLRPDIAIVDTRINQLLDQLATIPDDLEPTAKRSKEDAIWPDIVSLLNDRRRMTETERQRIIVAEEMIPKARALQMMNHIIHVIRSHVNDAATLAAIQQDLFGAATLAGNSRGTGSRAQ